MSENKDGKITTSQERLIQADKSKHEKEKFEKEKFEKERSMCEVLK